MTLIIDQHHEIKIIQNHRKTHFCSIPFIDFDYTKYVVEANLRYKITDMPARWYICCSQVIQITWIILWLCMIFEVMLCRHTEVEWESEREKKRQNELHLQRILNSCEIVVAVPSYLYIFGRKALKVFRRSTELDRCFHERDVWFTVIYGRLIRLLIIYIKAVKNVQPLLNSYF